MSRNLFLLGLAVVGCSPGLTRSLKIVTVAQKGQADFRTVQDALTAAGPSGMVIRIRPGTYEEKLTIDKPNIQLRGMGAGPSQVVLTWHDSTATIGRTFKSASVTVSAPDFYAENLTFENSYSRNRPLGEGSQAVAVRVTADRAVFRRVRFLGHQDTLYADGGGCDSEKGPCRPARQYFTDCYIEGNVDFIFGDALAFFENCEIHALPHSTVYLTAQSKRYNGEKSGYVFNHCRLTAAPGAEHVYLARPWRSHSTVVFLNTSMDGAIEPAGWHEWEHDGVTSLPTSYYAEYNSTGPGAHPRERDPHSRQLTASEAARFQLARWFRGEDHWNPRQIR